MKDNSVFGHWLSQPIPTMPDDEVALFKDKASIDAQPVMPLDHTKLLEALRSQADAKVIGVDLGGGSIRSKVFEVSPQGTLLATEDYTRITEGEAGEGFLEQLEAIAAYADTHKLAVGMSYGGPIDGTVPRYHPKIPALMNELQKNYAGDFAHIFHTPFTLLNDGPAGLLRSVEEIVRRGTADPSILYLINGGGLGVGVFKDGHLYSTEAGHIACVDGLNQNDVRRLCGLYGNYVCLENIISNKQGFELQWRDHTGEHLSGKAIEDRARQGDHFAMKLFEQAALVEATLLKGVAKVFSLDIHDPGFHVVVHGGLHRTPKLKERVAQILWGIGTPEKQILFTEDFDQNACMHGAALYALIADKVQ